MAALPALIGRNKFDEWCWLRGLELKPIADALGCSVETVRRIRLPFSHRDRRVPNDDLMPRIVTFTHGMVGPPDFYPPHLLRSEAADRAAATAEA